LTNKLTKQHVGSSRSDRMKKPSDRKRLNRIVIEQAVRSGSHCKSLGLDLARNCQGTEFGQRMGAMLPLDGNGTCVFGSSHTVHLCGFSE